ncbi:MAG: hypothetical protein CL677_01125 [Bdellovibrionaceae bacterium]|nr:hypothetical protein [Pseudobdellovibrionaceae bacterium]|tara:strand:- start:77576 stop:78649 length:1074 start_codon:yes stop_codon:yes gene_type:complete
MGMLTLDQPATSQDLLLGGGVFTLLIRECIESAFNSGASDIHIEPKEKGIVIRHRIDGRLSLWKTIPNELKQSLTIELKRVCKLSLAVSGRPQDKRISLPYIGLDLRVNSTPTLHGERVVLRLLDRTGLRNLEDSGFDDLTMGVLRESLSYRNGVILITGPTGSGKTSTLYSMIKEIDARSKNIATLEDPIEYTLDNISQSQATKKMSLAEGLRALLRQDPDVILVGEIRDEETAKLCFQAASTGHLVLSTLHTNGAKEAKERLKNLGIDELTLSSNIRFIGSQSLEKRLCVSCRKKGFSSTYTANQKGCPKCKFGYSGRTPLMEYIYGSGNEEKYRSRNDALKTLIERGICDDSTI